MSWKTHPVVVFLRDVGRTLGVNDWIAACLPRAGYEAAYDDALANAIRPGDVVWDVGANVGYYTKRFADRIGAQGAVVAFEPSPDNFRRLVQTCGSLPNVTLHNYGLGREMATVPFQQSRDALGATSRIVEGNEFAFEIELHSAFGVVETFRVTRPNAVKVDVEGYELEVIEGLGPLLNDRLLRVIGIEMHFRILKERGLSSAARQIERLLISAGFMIDWQDSSHLLAQRHSR